jgi:uncharacterized membrane protein
VRSRVKTSRTAKTSGQSNLPVDRDIQQVAHLEQAAYQARSRMDHLAGAITRIAGTGTVLLLHGVWFLIWVLANVRLLGVEPFDPFPFSLLTTIVSLEAIFLTLFVLISQNRMTHDADKRAELDLQINVLAERETTMILKILHDISAHLGLKGTASKELAELLKETKLDELSDKLEKALPPED